MQLVSTTIFTKNGFKKSNTDNEPFFSAKVVLTGGLESVESDLKLVKKDEDVNERERDGFCENHPFCDTKKVDVGSDWK